jgi:hypothetical protein
MLGGRSECDRVSGRLHGAKGPNLVTVPAVAVPIGVSALLALMARASDRTRSKATIFRRRPTVRHSPYAPGS